MAFIDMDIWAFDGVSIKYLLIRRVTIADTMIDIQENQMEDELVIIM